MEKYILINQALGSQRIFLSADLIYCALDTSTTPDSIVLTYADKQLRLESTVAEDLKQAEVDVINDAVAKCWSQKYADATIEISKDIPVSSLTVTSV